MAGLCKVFRKKNKTKNFPKDNPDRDAIYGFLPPRRAVSSPNVSKLDTSEYELMTSPAQPPTKQKKTQPKKRDSSEILDQTLSEASLTTPANLPMVVIRDYYPNSTQYDGVKVSSGTIVSALYKTGKYLFVRTPENNTGFLPSSVVRPLCTLKDIKSSIDKNLYQNLPTQPNRNVKFVSPGRCSTTSSCSYVPSGLCHCHICMDISSQSCRAPSMCDPRLYNSTFCSCCTVDSRMGTLTSNLGLLSHNARSNYRSRDSTKKRLSDRDSSFDSCYASSEMSSSSSGLDEGQSHTSKRCTPCTRNRQPTPLNSQRSRYQQCCHPSTCNSNLRISSTPICSSERLHKRRPTSTFRGNRLTVIFDFEGHFESDLSVKRQDVVTLLDEEGLDWLWVRRSDGKEGFIPRSYTVNLEALNLDPHCRTTYL